MGGVRSLLLVAGMSVIGGPLAAQGRASFEATAGLGFIEAAKSHQDHAGLVIDATVAWRLRRGLGQTGVLALTAGTQGSLGSIDACDVAPGGGCMPDYARFHTVAALIGAESRLLFGVPLRVLVGPAFYHGRTREGDSRGELGLQSRIDVATPAVRRAAFVASVRAGCPFQRLDDREYMIGAVAVGLRLQ